MTTTTVIDYVLGRLHDIGVTDIFGVPGDFAFPSKTRSSRIPISTGLAAAMNSMLPTPPTATPASAVSAPSAPPTASANSARSARSPAPMPSTCRSSTSRACPTSPPRPTALVHHTLGNGEFELFRRMADIVVGASAIITPANVVFESRHRARRHPRRACAVSSMSGSQCGVLPARTGRAPTVPILGRTV